jgi:hypothetical protein
MLGNLQYQWRTDDSATLFHRDRRVAWQGYVCCLRLNLTAPELPLVTGRRGSALPVGGHRLIRHCQIR